MNKKKLIEIQKDIEHAVHSSRCHRWVEETMYIDQCCVVVDFINISMSMCLIFPILVTIKTMYKKEPAVTNMLSRHRFFFSKLEK